MAEAPLIIGRNVRTILTIDAKKLTIYPVSGSVAPNLTEYDDNICGEERARLGSIVNWFDINLSVRAKDASPVLSFLGYIDDLDAEVPPQIIQMGILISPPGGNRQSFVARDITLGKWQLSWSNRADRVPIEIPMRASYFVKAATI